MAGQSRALASTVVLAIVACASLASCANVEPWERGNLAKPQMSFEPNPAQSDLRSHVHGAREAGASGNAGAGGGCGCT